MTDAIGWPQPAAHGRPLSTGRLRVEVDDFVVEELPSWTPDGSGFHQVICVEKRDANTQWVARGLARHAGCRSADVGYAGLKDRRAVTRQWFSVPAQTDIDWSSLQLEGVRILRVDRHGRKIRTGALRGNRFEIRVRDVIADKATVADRIAAIQASGVPNYFGPQRFGHDGGNLDLATQLAGGRRLRRTERGFALSAARSLIFNHVLAARVERGDWNQVVTGELAMLAGSNSFFEVPDDAASASAQARALAMDVHPSGPLWGDGRVQPSEPLRSFEQSVADRFPALQAALQRGRAEAARRALRMSLDDLRFDYTSDVLSLAFTLPRGSFATALVNELIEPISPPVAQ